MTAKRATRTLAVAAALVLAGVPADAQGSRRGGGRSQVGGSHHGGYAVPRGGAYGGGLAQARHPRAGTGAYGHHGGYYGGHYGGHYRPYSHGYYGHGHGYGYPYYRPYAYSSFYFGWPYAYAGWWPYGWSGGAGYYPYSAPNYGSAEAPPARENEPPYDADRDSSNRPPASDQDTGQLRLHVTPPDASVYVDDQFVGTAREARNLTL